MCQHSNADELNYCINCGEKLPPIQSLSFCSQCGGQVMGDMRFCIRCGAELQPPLSVESDAMQPYTQPPPQEPVFQPYIPPQQYPPQPPYKPPKKYGKSLAVAAICIVAVLIVVIIVSGFIKGGTQDSSWQNPITPGGTQYTNPSDEQYTNPNDWDNDDIPNTWETTHGLNPKDATDAKLDPDKDGLTNLQEYQLDSNINSPDLFIEIDYLSEYKPNQNVLNYLTTYYSILETECYPNGITVHITVDDNVTNSQLSSIGVTSETLSSSECAKIESKFHDNPNTYLYVFYAKSFYENALGWASNSFGAFLATQSIYDCANADWWYAWLVGDVTHEELEQVVLLHEVGHCVGILDTDSSGDEIYCSIKACAMNYADNSNWDGTNADGTCTYCFHHANQIDLTKKWSVNTYTSSIQWTSGSYTSGGLRGYYYDNSDFTNLKFTKVNSTINFDWGYSAPTGLTGSDYFSIGWKGKIKIPSAGYYYFYTSTDDGVKLWIDGKLAIDDWKNHWETERSVQMYFSGSGSYYIEMEYYEDTGDTAAKLYWSSSTISKQIIPSTNLYYLG